MSNNAAHYNAGQTNLLRPCIAMLHFRLRRSTEQAFLLSHFFFFKFPAREAVARARAAKTSRER